MDSGLPKRSASTHAAWLSRDIFPFRIFYQCCLPCLLFAYAQLVCATLRTPLGVRVLFILSNYLAMRGNIYPNLYARISRVHLRARDSEGRRDAGGGREMGGNRRVRLPGCYSEPSETRDLT